MKIRLLKIVLGGALLCFFGCSCGLKRESTMSEEYLDTIRNLHGKKEAAGLGLFHWTKEEECRILYISDHLVSFQIVKSVYSGGAHGMTYTRVGTFQDGVLLKLADLPDRKKVERLWQEAVARHFKAKSFEEHLRRSSVFKPYMTENFYLDDRGIHFIYDPYEIDCYAAGTIDIFVPWNSEGIF